MRCSKKKAIKELDWKPIYNIDKIIETAYIWYSKKLPLIKDVLEKQYYYEIH